MVPRRVRSPLALGVVSTALLLSIALVGQVRSPLSMLEPAARAVADSLVDRLGAEPVALRASRTPGGERIDLTIEIDGARVLARTVRIERTRTGSWRPAAVPDLPEGARTRPIRFDPLVRAAALVDTAAGMRGAGTAERVWFHHDGAWIAGAVVSFPLRRYRGEPLPWRDGPPERGGPVDLELRFDADGTVLEARDLLIRIGWTGRGSVFDPNPVAASGIRSLRNGDPVDGWRVEVDLERLDGSGTLRGERVRVESAHLRTAREESFEFHYPSTDPRFEEVMAYYHIDRARAWLERLGYRDLFTDAQRVTLHASPLDNSWYSPLTRRIEFGDGGVDDAEDADIILHEFAHAVHDAFVPGFGDGDTRAISEGFADYLAATLTGDPCVGDWDATFYSPPCLRRTDGTLRYPDDLRGSSHDDGEIWSGALWAIRERLGRSLADLVVLEGLLRQTPASTFPEAAAEIVRAADALDLGESVQEIREILADRGLIERAGVVRLAAGEEGTVPLDRAWPAEPGARSLRFTADGAVALGDCLILCPFRTGSPAGIEIRYAADRRGFGWEWEVRAQQRVARGTVLLSADGALDLVWLGDSSPWPDGEAGILVRDDPPVLLPIEEAFAGRLVPSSFLVEIGGGAEPIGAARAVLRRAATGWSTETWLPPRMGSRLRLLPLSNPSVGETPIRIDLASSGRATLTVFDPAGRRVRRLLHGVEMPPGPHRIVWDGRDEKGRATAAGVYRIVLEGLGERRSGSIVRIGR